MKSHCKKPTCINWAEPRKEYCRKHNEEIKQKAKIYSGEVK